MIHNEFTDASRNLKTYPKAAGKNEWKLDQLGQLQYEEGVEMQTTSDKW